MLDRTYQNHQDLLRCRITFCIATTLAAALIAAAARVPTKADARLTETDSSTGHAAFLSPHIHPIETTNTLVYVANTPAGTIDVIDQKTQAITAVGYGGRSRNGYRQAS